MFSADSDEDVPPRTELPRVARSRSRPRRIQASTSHSPASSQLGATSPTQDVAVGSRAMDGAVGSRSIEWHDWLHEFLRPTKERWGRQRRKLLAESMFTGMNPLAFCLAQGGIDIDDRIGAEQKVHAHTFMRNNRVLPKHCYKEADDMMKAGLAPSQPGYDRADIFSAGFPCQPYSTQARFKLQPTTHPLFRFTLLTIDYIKRTQPRLVLLENTIGFSQVADYFGDERSGLDLLQEALGSLYHIGWSKMNLSTWLDCHRPRLYIWLIAKDVGTSEDCDAIGEQIRFLESSRPERFRAHVEDFMFACGSEQWRQQVLLGLQCRGSSATSRAAQAETKGEQLADSHLQTLPRIQAGRLMGLQGTSRQQAMYQALVAARCVATNCDVTQQVQRANAMEGFKWDFSQNLPARSSSPEDGVGVDKALRSAVCGPLACMVRQSLPYSFERDRLILAEEMLCSHGWQIGAKVPDCKGLKAIELQDLVGEMQAVQTVSVVLWSILAVVASRLSGLFVPEE